MKILIAGGSGLIGQALTKALHPRHEITILGRSIERPSTITQAKNYYSWNDLENINANHYDVVMNLSGHNISDSRWSKATKKLIIDSRVNTNALLINWIIQNQAKPKFFSANAVGIYGLQEDGSPEALDEETAIDFQNPKDFLSEVGISWQQSLSAAIESGLEVTIPRFGIVLTKNGGMLKKLAPSFKFGLGSIIGTGRQILSWIHIDDAVSALIFLLERPELTGAFNLTSPQPVSQAEFAKCLAKNMNRPLFLKLPAFVIRMMFGEMGECLINHGQRVVPKKLLDMGFEFQFPLLDDALKHEFRAADN